MARPKVKKTRPKMETKEELIAYLEANPETELPFNEEVWNKAVEFTQDKERKFKQKIEVDFDGTQKVINIPNGSINPVSKYFQIIALPQYKKQAIKEAKEAEKESDDFSTGDEEKDMTVANWVNTFFNGYSAPDRKFLKERLSDYYDNYEINEGADKLQVIQAVADELELLNLTRARAKGKDVEARIEKVRKGYLSMLESHKALKKQRSAMDDEGKNKLTLLVDKYEKEGAFKPSAFKYDEDALDKMLTVYIRSAMEVYKNG
jgi:hypothetical protein